MRETKKENFKVKDKRFNANKSTNAIAKFFNFSDLNTTFKKEIIGGISTFLSMMYILSVEPAILGSAPSITGNGTMDSQGVFLATALVTALATIVMGMSANVPIGLAPSMGLNALFAFNIAQAGKIGYEGALIAAMISSIILCIISITKLRAIMINALPHSLHLIIGVAIGFFIAYVGISNMGFVEKTTSGLPVANLSNFKLNYPAMIVGTIVLFGSIILFFKKFFAPVAVMMLGGLIFTVILANTVDAAAIKESFGNAKWVSGSWNFDSLFSGFAANIKNLFSQIGHSEIWNKPTMYIFIFVLVVLNFFDATGTLTSINIELNKAIGQEREIPQRALVIDAGATIVGSGLGVSHMACYSESCVGISQGARTGFASIITGLLFLVSIPLFRIFKMMPNCITGAVTAFIGTIMVTSITEIEWKKPEIGITGFFSILFMVITYNIANGIAVGIISYTVASIGIGKTKEIKPVIWGLDAIFIMYFIASAFIQ
ncbi:NCS2 family permease [Mesoplasma melaleucae]|uniref:Xanthine/uracil permease n=1 Tax=Mesoplasma melaleucae TaxID=81459 RepID=A0A2K8NUZ8_9MOLU|nr:NCS2 family permease [Mesoplasma melaleucae]ATZ17639.1 xanthine/uracil permease [Mesoplasma melaleucae]